MSGSAASELAYLSRALKAPRVIAVAGRLAERARDEGTLGQTPRDEGWDYEAYLAAVLAEEVSARDSHGGSARVKAARFPAVKTIDDFDFTVQTSVSRQTIAHLAQLDFLAEAQNVVFLGPPGTGKTHLSVALGVQAARRGHRVAFATAHQWVNRLGAAKRAGRLDDELERLSRFPLLIVDEVGYIPFDPEAAALFFALISSRYERRSLIVSSNKTFSAWAEIFGDPVAVAAMVDRLVHHAEVIVLKGDSYRLRGKREEVLSGEGKR
jgi:DNA replication protein DnaC